MDKASILLIDDENEFVETLAERLEIRGCVSRIASDGEAGISMVTSESFDVVILDLMMPGLSGLDTLRQIKTIDKALPVIILTGHGSTKDAMEGMHIGAFDFLMKPLDISELLEKIQLASRESSKG